MNDVSSAADHEPTSAERGLQAEILNQTDDAFNHPSEQVRKLAWAVIDNCLDELNARKELAELSSRSEVRNA